VKVSTKSERERGEKTKLKIFDYSYLIDKKTIFKAIDIRVRSK